MTIDQCADAAFYKGKLEYRDGADKTHIGKVFSGFHNFRKESEHLSVLNSWQRCVNTEDTEWWCLHGLPFGTILETDFIPLNGSFKVPSGKSIVVLEGTCETSEGLLVKSMNHVKPREYDYIINGDAKLFLISKQA